MRLLYQRDRNTLTIQIEGELDHHTSNQVKKELDKVIEDISIQNLVFDFKDLYFMDSSGIGVILGRYKIINKRQGTIYIKNVNPHINKILDVSGLYNIVKMIYNNDKEL